MEQVYIQITYNLSKHDILIIIDKLLITKLNIDRQHWLTQLYLSVKNNAKLQPYNDSVYNLFSERTCQQCSKGIHYKLGEVYQLSTLVHPYWEICYTCALFNENLPIKIGDIVCKEYLNKIILLDKILIKDVIYYIGGKMIFC